MLAVGGNLVCDDHGCSITATHVYAVGGSSAAA
jgi:hypothetical protein